VFSNYRIKINSMQTELRKFVHNSEVSQVFFVGYEKSVSPRKAIERKFIEPPPLMIAKFYA